MVGLKRHGPKRQPWYECRSMQHWASELIEGLKQDVVVLNRRGCEQEAKILDGIIQEAESLQRAYMTLTMTLAEAEEYTELSRRTLERWLADGTVTPAGEAGAPKVYLCELPTPVRKMDSLTAARAQKSRATHGGKRAGPRKTETVAYPGLPELEPTEIRIA